VVKAAKAAEKAVSQDVADSEVQDVADSEVQDVADPQEVVTYRSGSNRRVISRNRQVKSGHMVVLWPWESRYQLAQPEFQTDPLSFVCRRWLY
jgi:hypothetical protein